jgi:hypothetical protein
MTRGQALGPHDAILAGEPADLIDPGGTRVHQPLPEPMRGLEGLRLHPRDRHKPPGGADIQDIIAAEDKFTIRFAFTGQLASGQSISAEANYFYHLRDGKISAFWLLADIEFDYRADD